MITVCHACATDIIDGFLSCNGFCKAEFHLKCCNIGSTLADELARNKQLFWMCQSCTKLMDDIRFVSSVRAAHETGQKTAVCSHNEIVEKLKSEMMVELKKEIRSNFTALINSSSLTPKSSTRPETAVGTLRSRRLFPNPVTNEPRHQDLLVGTGNSLSPSLGTFTVPAPNKKFWIYLSRISRDVSAEQIRDLTAHRLDTQDIEVFRLVANGKNINELTFISFKIGVNYDLKAKALSPSTWPKGILFREFRDNKVYSNFWRPQHTPPADRSINPATRNPVNHQDTAME